MDFKEMIKKIEQNMGWAEMAALHNSPDQGGMEEAYRLLGVLCRELDALHLLDHEVEGV